MGTCRVAGSALESAADLEAIDPGEHQVEHDEVGQTTARRRQGFFAATDAGDGEALLLEVVLDQSQDVALVVDDQDVLVCHATSEVHER